MAAGQNAHKENRPEKTTCPVKYICYNGAVGTAVHPVISMSQAASSLSFTVQEQTLERFVSKDWSSCGNVFGVNAFGHDHQITLG